MTLDRTDRELLNRLQQGLPLVPEPFAEIGNAPGVSGEEVLRRTAALKEDGLIRRLSGFFNGTALGYTSVLCAIELPENRIEGAAELLDAIPGVTHNYLRDHRLNLWFTLSCRSVEEQDSILRDVEARVGTGRVRRFPAVARYKIQAVFDMREQDSRSFPRKETDERDSLSDRQPPVRGQSVRGQSVRGQSVRGQSVQGQSVQEQSKQGQGAGQGGAVHEQRQPVTEWEIRLIRLLQEDFPLCPRPFAVMGERLGVPEREILETAESLLRTGKLKRIAAALRHRRAGYGANSMAVWDVPEDRLSAAADAVVPLPQVTHCYARERAADFDYNFYTMVHETSQERLDELIKKMEGVIQPVKSASLNTLRELKKTGMKYFLEEERA